MSAIFGFDGFTNACIVSVVIPNPSPVFRLIPKNDCPVPIKDKSL